MRWKEHSFVGTCFLPEHDTKKKWKKQLLLSAVHRVLEEAPQSVYLVAMHLHISRQPCGTMTNLTAFTARIVVAFDFNILRLVVSCQIVEMNQPLSLQ